MESSTRKKSNRKKSDLGISSCVSKNIVRDREPIGLENDESTKEEALQDAWSKELLDQILDPLVAVKSLPSRDDHLERISRRPSPDPKAS